MARSMNLSIYFIGLTNMWIHQALIQTVDSILPPRCPVTGEVVDGQGLVSAKAWAALDFIAPPFCKCCGFPFDFTSSHVDGDALCAACLRDPPAFDAARAALRYGDSSRDLILGFKHGDQTQIAPALTGWMLAAAKEFLEDIDVLIPVPLHRWRLLKRRYNQASILSSAMAKRAGKNHIPDGLIRVRSTPSQGHLNAKQRADNVRRAVTINPKRQDMIRGKKILLIDDVYTTGSTVEECTRALKAGGGEAVYVVTLARVVTPVKT
jgi:ComF family protein